MNTCALILLSSAITVSSSGAPRAVYVDPCAIIQVSEGYASQNEVTLRFVNENSTVLVRGNIVDITKMINDARAKSQ